MEIRRFYLNSLIIGDTIRVEGEEFRHMVNVLRHKVGYKVILCDNSGYDFYSTITEIGKDFALCNVDEKIFNDSENNADITLFMCCIKDEKMEIALQKSVELGVNTIVPVISANVNEKKVRIDRLERIVLEASKQCGRSKLAKVTESISFSRAVEEMQKKDISIMAYEGEKNCQLKSILPDIVNPSIAIMIGSEGGFTKEEAEQAVANNIKVFTLGKRILRAETAAITVLSYVMLRYDK